MQYYRKSLKFREKLEIFLPGLKETTEAFVVSPGTSVEIIVSSALKRYKYNTIKFSNC